MALSPAVEQPRPGVFPVKTNLLHHNLTPPCCPGEGEGASQTGQGEVQSGNTLPLDEPMPAPRAVIFDVYRTLLDVLPPPADADGRWVELWRAALGGEPRLGLPDFGAACQAAIAREHAAARAAGVPHPEVYWPDIVREVLPELSRLTPAEQAAFQLRQIELWHGTRLAEGAEDVLRTLRDRRVLLGLATNCQPYSLTELDAALAGVGLGRRLFRGELCFLSFEHGFAKPAPEVFRLLTVRLQARGVAAQETLMVGDRPDNDLAPARAQGWRTWRLAADAPPGEGGSWRTLREALAGWK